MSTTFFSEQARLEEILDMRFNKYDNTHIVALAVNAPCRPTEIYPEDCSFVDIMKRLDPTFNARQRTLIAMSQDEIDTFAAQFVADMITDVRNTGQCFPTQEQEVDFLPRVYQTFKVDSMTRPLN